jgi:hypothetical protein
MSTSTAPSNAIALAVAIVMLAGCSGGSSPIAPPALGSASEAESSSATTRVAQARQLARMLALRNGAVGDVVTMRSFMSPDAVGKPLIFASNSLGSAHHSVVDIYLQRDKNKMVGQITGLYGPRGMATDKADNVYIESEGDSKIFVYAPPYTGAPAFTLDDTGWFSYDVAVSPQGIVAVANICNAPSCGGNGSVTFYAKNSTKACATVGDPNFYSVQDDGFDDRGNLYVDGYGATSPVVGEIKGGCHAKNITLLTTTNSINYPGGIKVDKTDGIAILDVGNKALYTYGPPKNGSLGSPISTVQLQAFNILYAFAFAASGRDVYVGAATSGYQVAEYSYPAGVLRKSFNAGGGVGVAVTPPLTP